MASAGSGSKGGRGDSRGSPGKAKENVAELLLKLNLTEEEEAILDFSDDEGEAAAGGAGMGGGGERSLPINRECEYCPIGHETRLGQSMRSQNKSDRGED